MRRTVLSLWIGIILLCSCKEDKRGLVVGKIQQASKLATTEFTIDKIVYGSKTKKIAWLIKLNETIFLAHSKAKIKTGIDLDKIKKEDIQIDEKTNSITIVLPAIEVINFSYPADSFRIDPNISNTKKTFNQLNVEDQEYLFQQAELDIRNNLQYMGLVKTTQNKTRQLLLGLIQPLGYSEIFIHFKSDELLVKTIDFEPDK